MAKVWSFRRRLAQGGAALSVATAALALSGSVTAFAQSSSIPHIEIHPNKPSVIELPVIPQGSYLDPGPGKPIRPDVPLGDDRNEDYVFPADVDGDGGSPPGDPTSGGGWSPLPGDTPSF